MVRRLVAPEVQGQASSASGVVHLDKAPCVLLPLSCGFRLSAALPLVLASMRGGGSPLPAVVRMVARGHMRRAIRRARELEDRA